MVALLGQLCVFFTPYAWFGHSLLGLCIQVVVALPLQLARVRSAWWIGAAVYAGFWWGREKMEYEFSLKALAGLHTVGPFWWRGWLPFEWDTASMWQFLSPTLVGLFAAFMMERRSSRMGRSRA